MFIFDILFWAGVQRCLYLINTQLTLLPLSLALLWTWPLSRHTQPFYSQRTQKPTIILHKHPSQGAAWMHTGLLYFNGLSELLFLDLKKKEQKFDWKTKKMFVRIQSRSPTHGHHHYGIFISSLQQTVLVQVVFFFRRYTDAHSTPPGINAPVWLHPGWRASGAQRRPDAVKSVQLSQMCYSFTTKPSPENQTTMQQLAVTNDCCWTVLSLAAGCLSPWISFP